MAQAQPAVLIPMSKGKGTITGIDNLKFWEMNYRWDPTHNEWNPLVFLLNKAQFGVKFEICLNVFHVKGLDLRETFHSGQFIEYFTCDRA